MSSSPVEILRHQAPHLLPVISSLPSSLKKWGKFEDEVLGGILVLLVVIATSSFALVFHREREGEQGGEGPPSGLPSDYFAIDRVYFDDWVDFMGNVYPTTSR
ncbi:MAG: hypothetical protein QXQ45_01745 [Candidatus Hadarchaeales archaeon]